MATGVALEQVPQPGHATERCCRSCTLNGYKIANPAILARIPRDELDASPDRATATRPTASRAPNPLRCTSAMAAALDTVAAEIRAIQATRATSGTDDASRAGR